MIEKARSLPRFPLQKMEARIAHDLSNCLTVILGRCELLLDKPPQEEEDRANLQEIRQAACRAASLMRQLLASSRRQSLHPGSAPGGSECILLVEDDPSVRQFAHRVLSEKGYHVVMVEDGRSALEEAQREGRRYDLLITDVVMPGLNGKQLAGILRRRYPGLEVLFISGYAEELIDWRGAGRDDIHFLQKPFGAELLLRKTRTILARGPGRPDREAGA